MCITRWSHAQDPRRVLIVASSSPGAILEEGLVRVQGELAAMGLGTEVRIDGAETAPVPKATSPAFQGALVFERFGDWLRIQAWNPATAVPVTQWIDASDPSVDAEVIAVRAVEALRAVLLPYSRSPKEGAPTPTPQKPQVEPRSDRPTRTEAHDTGVSPGRATRQRALVSLRVGPTLASDLGTDALHVGVQAGVGYGGPKLSVGAELSASRARVRGDNDDQRADLTRFAALLDGRLRIVSYDSWDAFAALGVGALHLRASGVARPGYVAESASHTSLIAAGELGFAYWFSSRVAMYLSARGSLAFDAPVIRIDGRAIATLDRPQLGGSTGILIALD